MVSWMFVFLAGIVVIGVVVIAVVAVVVTHSSRGRQVPPANPDLVDCAMCHGTVSPHAATCPHCGHPLKPVA